MRGSPANRVPLDHDEDIEGFSATVVRRGSFCDEAKEIGWRIFTLGRRSDELWSIEDV